MNIARVLLDASARSPSEAAVLFGAERLSYGVLAHRVGKLAAVLQARGVRRGDRVGLFLPNGPDFMYGYYASLVLGAVIVSIGAASSHEEAVHAVCDSEAKVVVTTAALSQRLSGGIPGDVQILLTDGEGEGSLERRLAVAAPVADIAEMDASDPAAIVYSSGTTGRPKGVVLSHGNVDFTARSKVRYLGITPRDRLLLFLPMHHCFGQNAVMHAAVAAGACLVVQTRFEPDAVLSALAEDGVTMFFGVPTTFLALYDRLTPEHLRTVRYWFSAAASLPRALEERWRERFGAPIYQGYGLSESSPFASYNHLGGPRPGTVGTPIEGVAMRIVDPETGAPLPSGVPGEIVIRGPNVMIGYWRRPAETAETIRDGWLHSGDIGRVGDDGFFTVEDRVKDMIVVGGENVYPAEVENVIYGHPGVAEVAVFGVAEPYLGEEVRARIVRRAGCEAGVDEILELCRRRLAPFKVPTVVEFTESLPKSPTGKILKRILREDAAARSASGGAGGSVEDFVGGWLTERLGIERGSLDPVRPFVDYGVDSVLGVALARDLGGFLEMDLEPTLVWEFPSLNSLAEGIAERRKEASGATAA